MFCQQQARYCTGVSAACCCSSRQGPRRCSSAAALAPPSGSGAGAGHSCGVSTALSHQPKSRFFTEIASFARRRRRWSLCSSQRAARSANVRVDCPRLAHSPAPWLPPRPAWRSPTALRDPALGRPARVVPVPRAARENERRHRSGHSSFYEGVPSFPGSVISARVGVRAPSQSGWQRGTLTPARHGSARFF